MTSTSDRRGNGQTRTYDRADSVVFRKTNEAFGGLSNMAGGFPLEVNGIRILTSEALYQACRFPHLPEVQWLIIEQKSPMTAKMKGKPHRHESRPDWDRVRTKIMRWCLRVKLVQNRAKFSDLLLETGNKPIVEESKKDNFWGAKPLDDGTLEGRNVLGRLLMELREELLSQNRQAYERIAPLEIPDFKLFGSAIVAVMALKEEEFEKSESQDAPLFLQPPPPELSAEESALERTSSPNAAEIVTGINEVSKETGGSTSIPKECKRLAEVDFPIAVVSRHAAREKSIRHGHPSTLHLWWARRPLASSRAMLLALLFPDPCDPYCPEEFKDKARGLLPPIVGPVGPKDADLRTKLLKFIGDFANWDLSADQIWLAAARGLVKAAHPKETPLIVDPFAGGGSIPLEALRVGCEAFASDLNPVACLIERVMLEDIPRHGPDLADALRRVGREIEKAAEKELGELYPLDPDGARPIAYLWARTVLCEAPHCGAEIPLARTMWLSKKANRRVALRPRVIQVDGRPPRVEFEIFAPMRESDVGPGFAVGGKASCPACRTVLDGKRVQAQLAAERGGASPRFDNHGNRIGGAVLIAVVTTQENSVGRSYRVAETRDYQAFFRATQRPVADAPTEEINPVRPSPNARGLSAVTRYGMKNFSDLYSRRQLEALCTFARLVSEQGSGAEKKILALAVGRVANAWTSLCRWHQTRETIEGAFNGQKIPMVWDFAEATPFSGATGGWDGAVEWGATFVERSSIIHTQGQVQQADAADAILPDASAAVWFTDPPYYDSVPYADLADFFLVWLQRAVPELRINDPYSPSNSLSPKVQECVWNQGQSDDQGNPKTPSFFEQKFSDATAIGRQTLADDGVACVVFAHKSTQGWEALLSGLTAGGLIVSASWPIATEMAQRTNARGTASLMGSVHLVCRPRTNDEIGDWAEVLRKLPGRVGDWMERLQTEGVRGADLVFACIGPALEIFSRHSKVETAEGREVGLPEYLEKVWEVVGRSALEQVLGTAEAQARNGLAGTLEEDARLTALFLWTLQSTNGGAEGNGADEFEEEDEAPRGKSKAYSLMFDVARRFAQPLGIRLPDWEGRIIETSKGVVRLMAVTERGKQLFGESGAGALADEIEVSPSAAAQLTLFPEETSAVRGRGRRSGRTASVTAGNLEASLEATTLDRVHAAMLLQASGRSQALRNLLKAEQERGPDFLRLANALSALYPRGSEEKRLLDAMLLAVPR